MMSTTTEYFLNFSQPLQHKFVVKIKFTPFLEFRRCVFFISKIGHSLPLYSLLSYLSSNFYTIFFCLSLGFELGSSEMWSVRWPQDRPHHGPKLFSIWYNWKATLLHFFIPLFDFVTFGSAINKVEMIEAGRAERKGYYVRSSYDSWPNDNSLKHFQSNTTAR